MPVIELVGPAGVGKSTVSAALAEVCPASVRLTAYHASSLLALGRSPAEVVRCIRFVRRAGGLPLLFTKTGINWLFVVGALLYGRRLARRSGAVVVFDQLVFQALRKVARRSGRSVADLARSSGSLIATADAIVTVWAPLATVRQRRLRRGDDEADLADLDSVSRFRRGWLDTRRGIRIVAARQVPRPSLLHLDGRSSIEENRHRLQALVQSIRGRAQ